MDDPIADRKYQSLVDGADWIISADDLVQIHLDLALSRIVPDWPGATDDQLWEVAKIIVTALDETPRASIG